MSDGEQDQASVDDDQKGVSSSNSLYSSEMVPGYENEYVYNVGDIEDYGGSDNELEAGAGNAGMAASSTASSVVVDYTTYYSDDGDDEQQANESDSNSKAKISSASFRLSRAQKEFGGDSRFDKEVASYYSMSLDRLPSIIVLRIFTLLFPVDLCRLAQTSKRMCLLSSRKSIWKPLYVEQWGSPHDSTFNDEFCKTWKDLYRESVEWATRPGDDSADDAQLQVYRSPGRRRQQQLYGHSADGAGSDEWRDDDDGAWGDDDDDFYDESRPLFDARVYANPMYDALQNKPALIDADAASTNMVINDGDVEAASSAAAASLSSAVVDYHDAAAATNYGDFPSIVVGNSMFAALPVPVRPPTDDDDDDDDYDMDYFADEDAEIVRQLLKMDAQ
jgi:F-box-like